MLLKCILCIIGIFKLILIKIFNWKNIEFSLNSYVYPSVLFSLSKQGRLVLKEKVSIRRNTEINVRNNAIVEIGRNTFLNSGCIITAHKAIYIGDNVEFGPGVMIFDHDHKFKSGYEPRKFDIADIRIGNNVWVGANTIILKGSRIGESSVIGAGSIVKGDIPPGSLYIQRRDTCITKIYA